MSEMHSEDADVPALAVEALRAAQKRAVLAGHPQVLVRNRQLVRIVGGEIVVLKQMMGRKKVVARTKSVQ